MNQEYEELKARVDALESAVRAIGKENPGIEMKLRTLFHREYSEAERQANTTDQIDIGTVRSQPRPARNPLAEQARVSVFKRFARMFGAEV